MAEEARKAWTLFEKEQVTGAQITAIFEKIFKRDCTKEQADKILEACSPYQVTGHDTPSEVRSFLSDFNALEGKVSTSFPAPSMENYFDLTSQRGRLSTCIGSLLSKQASGCGEEFVLLKAMNFQRIWEVLREAAAGPKQLNYTSTRNVAEKNTNNWKFFIKSKRPDNVIMSRGKVYAFGEEKEKAEEFEKAKSELTAKIVELPPAMYGKVKFLICYAAAGQFTQFFILRLRKLDGSPVLTPVTEMLDATVDLPRLVLFYIKLYFLLLGMDASVGGELPFPLHVDTYHGYCQIKLTLDGATKTIPDFEAYSNKHKVCFDDLKAAYTAAKLSCGYMISSVFGPRLESKEVEVQRQVETAVTEGELRFSRSASTSDSHSGSAKRNSSPTAKTSGRKKGRTMKTVTKSKELSKVMKQMYEVDTLPLCAEKEPKTEEDMRDMAFGVLRGLKALHNAGLVHRDIRFPNIMYDYSEDKYVLIDLESVGKDEEVPAFKYRGWNAGTLDENNCYTKLSDFHHLGLLLRAAEVEGKSKACVDFIDMLLSKSPGTTAESLLQHKWISQLSGDQTAATP